MAKVKTTAEIEQQAAKRKRLRTVTKADKFISGVVRILKNKKNGNVAKSAVRKFIENYDFDKNEENLLKLYEERLPKNVNPMAGGKPKNTLYALAYELEMKNQNYFENSKVSF
jgi:hypothetical protein